MLSFASFNPLLVDFDATREDGIGLPTKANADTEEKRAKTAAMAKVNFFKDNIFFLYNFSMDFKTDFFTKTSSNPFYNGISACITLFIDLSKSSNFTIKNYS